MIKKLLTVLFADDNILCFNEGSSDTLFSCNEMGILSVELNSINLDYANYDEDDPETLFISDFWLGIVSLKNAKRLKKLMLVA